MKIIVSHDVDHLNVSEHFNDLIIPKFIVRSNIELLTGKISINEFTNRFKELFSNKWNKIEDLINFNLTHKIPATFFIGVNNGLGLNYPITKAEVAIKLIQSKGFDVGVHGIAFDNFTDIQKEFESFAKIIGNINFGVRMHYLRNIENTTDYLSQAGYLFDATLPEMKSVYTVNNLTVFPVHIMDGWIMNNNKAWQINNIDKALDLSKKQIDEGMKNRIDYFSILFHDHYFSDSFKTWKNWYIKLMEYLILNKFQFIDYKAAIEERKNKHD